MKIGITGLPFSGKSTVFGALTFSRQAQQEAAAKRATNQRLVNVPDPRLDLLAEVFEPKKYTMATVEYVDIPGFGGNDAYFAQLREVEALALVVRAFEDESVPHEKGSVDAARDLDELNTELCLSDLVPIEKRIEKLEKQLKKTASKTIEEDKAELAVLEKLREPLENAKPLRSVGLTEDEEKLIRSFGFITLKPWLILKNLGDDDDPGAQDEQSISVEGGQAEIAMRGKLECELCGLDEDDRKEFMADLGVTELVGAQVIRLSYRLLDRVSFLTGGPKEVRAWPIPRGMKAPAAAGTIHSDMERGFIRAEVIGWEDFVATRSFAEARSKGKARLEGKEYVMQDGDVTEIRFSV